ncbi:cation:proton antiporter [Candidatus Dojkabacteria bacterium]|nr:cation:proton antiporter [Candidatus Dojkabacteria bacterium]
MKQPVIIGYILVGAILTLPFAAKFVRIENSIRLAEIGAALLLFAIGIEFSLDKLLRVKKIVFLGGTLQIILTILLGWFIFRIFNLSSFEALALSSVFSLSSTAIAIKILEKRHELDTKSGEIMIGWLILQDIAVVFLVILLLNVGAKVSFNIGTISNAILKSFVLIASAILIGRNLIPAVLRQIAKLKSNELLLLVSLIFPMILAYISEKIGLSFTLGAFLGGVMISESFLNNEIFTEVKPLRDVFSLIFFISIGTLFSFDFFFANLFKIVLIGTIIMGLKIVIVLFLTIWIGKQHPKIAFRVALGLPHVGEFAFLVTTILTAKGLINQDLSSIVISVTILSLMLAPALFDSADKLYNKAKVLTQQRNPKLHRLLFVRNTNKFEIDQPDLYDHTVICGYGRVGAYVGEALTKLKLPFIAIDFDSEKVERLQSEGLKIIYGDPSHREILDKADVERAKAIVLALPKEQDVNIISKISKEINPKVKVLARIHNGKDREVLARLGVDETVQPEFEAAVAIVHKVMQIFGEKDKKILYWLRNIKELNDINEKSNF